MSYTRITTKLMNDSVIQNLLMNRTRLNELNEQVVTQKKVTKPSDDCTAALSILNSKTSINQIDRYIKNIDFAKSELEIADKSVSSAIDVVHKAKELAIQASNATSGPTELAAINSSIEELINQIQDIGNTKFGNKYIFGGLVTETPPFSEDATGNVAYNGTPSTGNYQRQVEVSDNVLISMNFPGDNIFGQYDSSDPAKQQGLIATLKKLSEELKTTPPDYNNIRSKIDDLSKDLTTLLDAQANIGGTINRMDMTSSKLDQDSLTFEKFRSEAEDADLAKVISDLQFQETALQASLQVGAKVIQPSLLNFL